MIPSGTDETCGWCGLWLARCAPDGTPVELICENERVLWATTKETPE